MKKHFSKYSPFKKNNIEIHYDIQMKIFENGDVSVSVDNVDIIHEKKISYVMKELQKLYENTCEHIKIERSRPLKEKYHQYMTEILKKSHIHIVGSIFINTNSLDGLAFALYLEYPEKMHWKKQKNTIIISKYPLDHTDSKSQKTSQSIADLTNILEEDIEKGHMITFNGEIINIQQEKIQKIFYVTSDSLEKITKALEKCLSGFDQIYIQKGNFEYNETIRGYETIIINNTEGQKVETKMECIYNTITFMQNINFNQIQKKAYQNPKQYLDGDGSYGKGYGLIFDVNDPKKIILTTHYMYYSK